MATTSGQPEIAGARPESRLWFFVRPTTIYGTIIVSAVIVAADEDDSDIEIFVLTLGTIVMVWVAHVLSEVIAGDHAVTNPPTPFRTVLGHAMVHSSGLLVSAVLPLLTLLIGSLGGFSQHFAYYASLGIALVSLAVLGWLVFAHRGNAWPVRLAGAAGTALMGGIVIFLKSLIH
jgi:hypothetical protein